MGVIFLVIVAVVMLATLRHPDSIDVHEYIVPDAEYKKHN